MVGRQVEFDLDGRRFRHLVGHREPDDDIARSLRERWRLRGDVRPGCFRADETYCEDRCRGDDAACGKSGLTKCHWVLLPRVDRCAKSVVRHAREVPQRRSRPEVTLDGSKKIWLLADGWLLDLLGRSAAFLIAFPPTASTRPTGHGLVRSDEDRQYIAMNFLPFEEASSTATLQSFLKHVGRDKANGFSVYSWSAGLAFAQAATATVAKVGVNGLTRRSFLHVGDPDAHEIRRRRHARQGEHRGQAADAVLCARPAS